MEEVDKGCLMIRMGVFLLVPAYPGSPGPKAAKRLGVCVSVVKIIHVTVKIYSIYIDMNFGHASIGAQCTYINWYIRYVFKSSCTNKPQRICHVTETYILTITITAVHSETKY